MGYSKNTLLITVNCINKEGSKISSTSEYLLYTSFRTISLQQVYGHIRTGPCDSRICKS